MAENSKIQWTTHTFNPWRGCTKISAGCANCYAETLSGRNPRVLGMWGPNGTRVVASEDKWREPLKWNREAECTCGWNDGGHAWDCPQADERPRVFCASLADVFEEWDKPMIAANGIPLAKIDSRPWTVRTNDNEPTVSMDDVRRRLFDLIDATPNLDWLLLTKRPENVAKMMPEWRHTSHNVMGRKGLTLTTSGHYPPRPNLWLGTSVENQAAADARIPHLLGEVILHKYLAQCECGHGHGFTACPNTGGVAQTCHLCDCRALQSKLHWVIVGGESGPGARPCRVEWIRSIVEQCKAAGVPCFVKQMGSFIVDRNDRGFDAESEVFADGPNAGQPTDSKAWPSAWMDVEHNINGFLEEYQGADCRVRLRDKKGGDITEWPLDLQVREFPKVVLA